MITVNRRELALELVAAVREDAKLRGELVAALGVQAVPERFLSVRAYAELHGKGQSSIRAAIRDGRLEAVRNGGSVRIRAGALIAAPKAADTPRARADRAWGALHGRGART